MVVGGRELIDTLWNVNFYRFTICYKTNLELIDTLWNVNKEILISNTQDITGINRYIMECK